MPADVEYRRIPISWDDKSVPHVRIYYTLEALGKTNELHSKVFEAIQTKRMSLLKPEEIADFMATQGIDRKQWLDAYNSFSVGARTNRAGQVWRAYKIDGTPSHGRRWQVRYFAVNGGFTRGQPPRARQFDSARSSRTEKVALLAAVRA